MADQPPIQVGWLCNLLDDQNAGEANGWQPRACCPGQAAAWSFPALWSSGLWRLGTRTNGKEIKHFWVNTWEDLCFWMENQDNLVLHVLDARKKNNGFPLEAACRSRVLKFLLISIPFPVGNGIKNWRSKRTFYSYIDSIYYSTHCIRHHVS